MLALGTAVGTGTTPLDDWVARTATALTGPQPRWLLTFTSGPLALVVLAGCLAVTLHRRRWSLAAAVLVCPMLAVTAGQCLKRLFDRRNGPYLEYPSGHTTLLVAALGMLVLVSTARLWAWLVAIVLSVLGALGLVACGYHYFTDTIGAALLAGAVVGGAARLTSAE